MELQCSCIYKDNQCIGYGGNQDWFEDQCSQRAGCASVLGSNLYAYYCGMEVVESETFIKIMNDMYTYMTPGYMGYPYLKKFARTFVKVMAKENIYFKPVYLRKVRNYKQVSQYFKQSIDEHHPVGMLILHHRAKELEEDNWHWICLMGYIDKENGYDVVFSDCGERRIIDSKILFDVHPCNVFKFVRMKKDPTYEDQ